MLKHIEFCLDEIACEIEALDACVLAEPFKVGLEGNIASMRAIIGAARAAPASVAPTSAAAIRSAEPMADDDLTRIRGVTQADAEMLAAHGVKRFETIATWRRTEIEALGGGKKLRLRIAQENWIEQAAILAVGRSTAFASALDQRRALDQSPVQAMTAAIAAAMSLGDAPTAPSRRDIAA